MFCIHKNIEILNSRFTYFSYLSDIFKLTCLNSLKHVNLKSAFCFRKR